MGDIEKALDGFTRAVQLDPENGEAWNNITCLHMIKGKSKEAFMAFREALKFKRNSYQLWENYSHVALDVGNVAQVASMASPTNSAMSDDGDNFPVSGTTNAESDVGKSREAEHLVEFLGKVLQQIIGATTTSTRFGKLLGMESSRIFVFPSRSGLISRVVPEQKIVTIFRIWWRFA
ncbi:hypothetical protein ABKV19_026665 [Rosa sericea]